MAKEKLGRKETHNSTLLTLHDGSVRRNRHTLAKQPRPNLLPKRPTRREEDDDKSQDATHLPEPLLVARKVGHALEVHAEVAREERERQEDDCDGSENEDGLVLAVSHDGEFVLLDGFELEELEV